MKKILINDGIHPTGLKMLQEAGFEVSTDKIEQADLENHLPKYDAICVRSATKVRKDLIEKSPNLKVIGRGGVGLDNIDVEFAKSKDIHVVNTPAASSRSVAELVFAHVFSVSRFLQRSNREMPVSGSTEFKQLKKSYSKGVELGGRTLGVIGMGRIGQQTMKLGFGLGMNVIAHDPFVEEVKIDFNGLGSFAVKSHTMDSVLNNADVISLHVPSLGKPVIGATEFSKMKDGVIIVNAARGGVIDEDALLAALASGKVFGAGLDVFINEPTPREDLLNHPQISVSPHIGASTGEAQENIGKELAQQLIDLLN